MVFIEYAESSVMFLKSSGAYTYLKKMTASAAARVQKLHTYQKTEGGNCKDCLHAISNQILFNIHLHV